MLTFVDFIPTLQATAHATGIGSTAKCLVGVYCMPMILSGFKCASRIAESLLPQRSSCKIDNVLSASQCWFSE